MYRRLRGSRHVLSPVVCLTAILALSLALDGCGGSSASGPAPTPSADPRLIVRAHSQPVSGTLTGGVHLSGTLYPALPNVPNTLHVQAYGLGNDIGSRTLTLIATMPGMAMAPRHASLQGRAGTFTGSVTLPMFGNYLARVTITAPEKRYTGTLLLGLPLLLGQ